MRSARDTLLHYLSDNLPGLLVNFVRRDATNPNNSKMLVNAVNVQFFGDQLSTHVSKLQTSIDVIFYDELQAVDAVQLVVALLQKAGYTANINYTDTSNPVPTGTNIFWNPFTIKFSTVGSDLYFHYSCTLLISHYNQ